MSGQTCSVNLGWYREFTSSLLGARFFILKLGGFQNGSTFKRAKAKALELIEEAKELKGLNDVRVAYLGKKVQLQKYYAAWENYQQKSVHVWEH